MNRMAKTFAKSENTDDIVTAGTNGNTAGTDDGQESTVGKNEADRDNESTLQSQPRTEYEEKTGDREEYEYYYEDDDGNIIEVGGGDGEWQYYEADEEEIKDEKDEHELYENGNNEMTTMALENDNKYVD